MHICSPGHIKHGLFNGQGKLNADNFYYEGLWADAKRHGAGRLKCNKSAKFGYLSCEGSWHENMKHGLCTVQVSYLWLWHENTKHGLCTVQVRAV